MRYSGKFGYSVQTETSPGVWEDVITERDMLGTVLQRTEVLDGEGTILPRYRTTTSISVLSNGVNQMTYANLAYVVYKGIRWQPGSIVEEFPRLTVYIGDEYHGPTPE